jgi:O-antigen biosynthesis rhamnosyltransferase
LKQLKILHVYKESSILSHGGIPVAIDSICKATSKLNVKNQLLCLSQNPSPKPINLGHYEVIESKEAFSISSMPVSFTAIKIFKKLSDEVDVIHFHFPYPFADFLSLFDRVRPYVVTYHSDIVRQRFLKFFYRPLMEIFLKKSKKIIATSTNYLSSSLNLKHYRAKCEVIPLGLSENSYPSPDKDALSEWKSKLPKRFFLFLGAQRYYKGLHVLPEALVGEPDIYVVVAGKADKGLKKTRQSIYSESQENIIFLGSVTEQQKVILLTLCYAFIFPSHLRSEAFGLSLVEASMFGKAMISCDIGTGTSFVNLHEKTGLVVKPSDSDSFRKAMLFFLHNPDLVDLYGENAKQRYYELFTAEGQGTSYRKVYDDALHR